jgi:DHA2 family multidrug resistance protein
MVPLIAHIGQRKTIVVALSVLVASMLIFQHILTTDTATGYYFLPLVLYGLCLSPLLPAIGSGTVAQIAQEKLLDGVSLYMTFRQFGNSLGVALLNILLAHRETLHSARLFEHLHGNDGNAPTSLASRSANAIAHGYSSIDGQHLALAQLAEAARQQAATLSYADAFGFMAVIAVIALCLVPIIPATPAVRK